MKSFLKFLLFFGVGFGILFFVYQNQERAFQAECACKGGCEHATLLAKIMYDFSTAHLGWLAVVCVVFFASILSRALRWNLLIEPLGYKTKTFNTFFAIMIGYLFNLALPRAGELVKPALLSQYEKVPVDKLIGTIVVDRIFDVIMLALVLGFTFLVQFNNLMGFISGTNVPVATCVNASGAAPAGAGIPWLLLFGIACGLGLLTLAVIYWKWNQLKETELFKKIIALCLNFWAGIQTVFRLRSPFLFLFHTLFIWLMYYLMTYLCFFAYAPTANLGMDAALLAFVFGAFGVLIPSPGGMGTFQLGVTAALAIFQVPNAEAFAFANILFFVINVFCNLSSGILGYILMPLYNRGYEPIIPEHAQEKA